MLDQIIRRPQALRRIRNSYLSTFLDTFAEHLFSKGFSPGTIHHYLDSAEHFSRWLEEEKISPNAVSEDTVRSFIDSHLPKCHCPPLASRCVKTMRSALHHLLLILHPDQETNFSNRPLTKIDIEINQYDTYLGDVCGLAASTRHYRRRYAREFLCALFGSQPLDYNQISPKRIVRFVTDRARKYTSGSRSQLADSLRSYLKYLQLNGRCEASLVAAVPTIPRWSLTSLPETLTRTQVESFLSAFDRSTALGRRNYAMARCMTDLGLCRSEVARLQLDDIDWHAGIMHVFRGKTGRSDQLPLPDSRGKALADYLCKGRPQSQSRAMFVYHQAPLGEGVKATTVSNVIRCGYLLVYYRYTRTHGNCCQAF
jgi:site-specific recombinase XerD